MRKRILWALAAALTAALAGAQPPLPAPEGAIRAGSLANEILVRDTMLPVMAGAHAQGCRSPQGVVPFVKAEPSGAEGARRWQEIWVVRCGNRNYPMEITFRETGSGVSYMIR